MPFSDFQGNGATVRQLREMLDRDRFPHAVSLSGDYIAIGEYTFTDSPYFGVTQMVGYAAAPWVTAIGRHRAIR